MPHRKWSHRVSAFGLAAAASAMAGAATTRAATRTWDKDAGTLEWATPANWIEDTLPGASDIAKFAALGILAGDIINANGNRTVQQLQFGDGNDLSFPVDLTIANIPGGKITLRGGGADRDIAVQRGTKATGAVSITSNLEFVPSSGTVTALLINSQGASGNSNGIRISGLISEATPGIGLIKAGGKDLLLSALNTHTGMTTIRNGTLLIAANAPNNAPGALGSAISPVQLGDSATTGTQDLGLLTTGAFTVARDIAANTTPSTGAVTIGGHADQKVASIFSGTITLNRNARLRSATTGANAVEFSGKITGPAGIEKIGSGVVILSSAAGNDYTGATTVTGGTLRVNTSNTGHGVYLVHAPATLGGTGSIRGAVTIDDGAILAPGASIDSLGVVGNLVLNGSLAIQINGKNGRCDLLDVTGDLGIGATAKLDLIQTNPVDDDAYVFARYTTLAGAFTPSNIMGLPPGYSLDYAHQGNQIALVRVIPEPASAALAILAVATLAARKRRWRGESSS